MTTEKTRLSTYLPSDTEQFARDLAKARGVSVSAVLGRALRLMIDYDDAVRGGLTIGTTRDTEHLETIILAPF
jgi:hypothetical protein